MFDHFYSLVYLPYVAALVVLSLACVGRLLRLKVIEMGMKRRMEAKAGIAHSAGVLVVRGLGFRHEAFTPSTASSQNWTGTVPELGPTWSHRYGIGLESRERRNSRYLTWLRFGRTRRVCRIEEAQDLA